MAEALAEPALQVGRQRLAGGDRRRAPSANVVRGDSASSSAATKPGLAKNSVGCSVGDELGHAGRRRPTGLRIAVAPTANGNVSELPRP